jgi:chromosome segregation ATPase
LEITVTDLEDIQHQQIELTDMRRAKVDDKLEALNHKLHALSNMYMGMEEKLNELAEFASHMKSGLDDLRQSLKSFSD